jgi:hypothetical protein
MKQREYHCFLSGLPEIRLDESRIWTTPQEFIEAISHELHPDDFEMARLLLLRYDHENMVRFLMGGDLVHEGIAVYGAHDYIRQREVFGAIIQEDDILPPYLSEVLYSYSGTENPPDEVECRRKLNDGYYGWAMDKGSRFIRGYIEFEYNLTNLLTYLIHFQRGLNNPGKGISGHGSLARHLQEMPGKNLVKDPEFEYFDNILRIECSSGLAVSEMQYDRLRWNVIEKLTLFEYFTSDAVMAYLQKLLIASRWEHMTEVAGRAKLIETMDSTLDNTLAPLQNYE